MLMPSPRRVLGRGCCIWNHQLKSQIQSGPIDSNGQVKAFHSQPRPIVSYSKYLFSEYSLSATCIQRQTAVYEGKKPEQDGTAGISMLSAHQAVSMCSGSDIAFTDKEEASAVMVSAATLCSGS